MQLKSIGEVSTALKLIGDSEQTIEKVTIAINGLSKANAISVITSTSLTQAEKMQMLASIGCTEEEIKQALATSALAESEGVATASTLTLGTATKSLGTALKGLAAAHPLLLAITAIVGVVSVAKKVYDHFNVTIKEANDVMDEAVSTYETTKSELENINSELDANKQKIDELLSKDKLTYAEKGQLEELQEITKELEFQADIEQRKLENDQKNAANKAVQAYEKQYGNDDITDDNIQEKVKFAKNTGNTGVSKGDNDIAGNVAELQIFKSLLEDTENELKNASGMTDDEINSLNEDFQAYVDIISDTEDKLNSSLSDLESKRSAMEDQYKAAIDKKNSGALLSTDDKNIISTYEEILNAIELIYKYLDPNKYRDMQMSSIFDTEGIEKSKDELIEMAKAGKLDESTINGYKNLKTAMDENGVSAKDLCDDIYALADAEKTTSDAANKTSVSSFSDIWNSADFSDAKDKLLELAKSGEITPKTIESTTEYKKLIDDTGLSAQEVTNNITSMLSVQEKLSAANQGLDKLKSSYEEFKDIGFVTAQTLESLPDAFKTLPDFNIFEKIVGNPESGKEKIQQAFNDITKSYLLEQNTLSGLVNAGDSEVQTYIANLKQMGITNAEEIVTQTRQALSQENQLINSAESEYENAHLNYINGKSKMDADYLTQTSSKNGQLASALGSTYKQDYDNWCDLLSQKAEAYNSFVKAIGSSYDASKGITDNVNAAMAAGQSAFEVNKAASEYAAIKAKSEEMKNKIKLDLKQINVNFKSNYSPSTGSSKSKSGGSGSGSKAKDTKQTIDWITRALTALEKKLDSTKAKFENLFSLKSKSSNLDTQLKQIKALEKGYSKAANAYKKYASKVNLSSSLKKKVQSGSYSISDYSSATQEKIQQYQDYWDKYQDALSKQYEQKQAYREKQIEKYQLYVDDAESKISKYDTKIESTTSAKAKVSYLKEQNKLLSTSYDYQIKIAKAEGDSVKAETLSVEKTNKKNENLKAQYQAYLDETDAKLNKYESQYDNLTDTKSRVNNLKEQVKLIKSSYDYQVKIAQVDKDTVKVDQLKAEKQKEINENLKAQYQIYVDEADASKEMYDAQLSLESNYKEQNAILEKQKSDIIKSYDYQIKIAQVDKDIVKQKSLQAQKQKEINDLTKQEFDNISDTYSRILDYSNSQADVINAKISYIEEKGYVTSKNMYDQLISYVGENLETLDAELVILEKTLQDDLSSGKIKSGTDAWYEMVSAIQAVKKAQIEANTSLVEYEKNIRQLKWDAFDRAEDYISQIREESNFLIDLMSNKSMYDDNGNWTEYTNATAGLRVINYDAYMAQADDYEKEIQSIQQQINNDPYNIDLIERKNELRNTQRDLIKSAQDEKEAIKSLIEEGYNKWLDSLQEVIDKRKEELNQVSDLYEYEKKIAELTKDVSTYEKQKLALQGNDTEEAKAKIQKINVDLQNAKDNLEDTQYDQWKSDQESILDSLSNEAQEFINQRLDNIDGLLSEIVESTNNSADAIRTTLENVTSEVGTSLSAEMTQVLTPMGTITNIVSQFADSNFANTSLGVTLTAIKDYVAKISENSNNGNNDLTKQELSEIGKKEEEASKSDTSTKSEPVKPETTKPTTSNTTSTTKKPATTTSTTKKSTTTTASTKKATTTSTAKKTSTTNTSKKSSWGSWFIKKKFTGNKSKLNKDKSIVDRLKYKDFEAAFSARAKYYKAMGGTDKYTGYSKQNTWMIDQMKKHGFKSGGTIGSAINKSGEDGFVLARTGEEVLSLEKIKELGKSFQMINPVLNNLKTMIPDSQLVTRQNFGGNNIDKVQMEINLPNVTNYEEFKSELVKDKQFEKVVQSMTLGNALGKNSLSKYKIR